jgi:DNA-binding winged helix-turn-helix (wHTH) protein/Tfp pilus assembly protein PilF
MSHLAAEYRFGPFVVDVSQRLLFRKDKIVPLTPKGFELLLLLLERGGRVVEREELMRVVWPNVFVEEANLTQNIFALRKQLSDESELSEYIQTVPKRGYRFNPDLLDRESYTDQSVQAAKSAEANLSLAIMPFINETGEPEAEYLCDGLTESLIKNLSALPHLDLRSHSSVLRYKNANPRIEMVGKELSVKMALIGRIRIRRQRITINTELIDTLHGRYLWGERYEKSQQDVIEIQEEIAKDTANKLQLRLSQTEQALLSKKYTTNLQAYHHYLKGRFFWNKYTKKGLELSIKYFEMAIEEDSHYALAYSGLADAYLRLSNLYLTPREALSRAKAAAMEAVAIDGRLSEAHSSMGIVKIYLDHDWAGGEKEYQRAIELNPGAALPYKRYGECLMLTRRFAEALENLDRALALDPLSLQINLIKGTCLYVMRETPRAIAQLEKVLELNEDYAPGHLALALCYLLQQRPDDAFRELQTARRLDGDASTVLGYLGYAYGVSGRKDKATQVLKELEAAATHQYVSPYAVAITYLGLGDVENAMKLLQKTYEERNDFLIWFNVAPELDSLRQDLRFVTLLRRIKFPT